MNEILFMLQIVTIVAFAFGALKLGKGALTTWVCVQALIANLFVLKQITLLGFDVTASDAYIIGSFLGLNFLQEYHGKEEAKKATWICFFFMIFFALVSQLHLRYQPSAYDTTQHAFELLLTPSLRLLIASLTVFFIVQQIDIQIFAFFKSAVPQISFAFRTLIALILSQFLDTVLFSFVGLYGIAESILSVIAISFAVKLVTILCCSYATRWAKS